MFTVRRLANVKIKHFGSVYVSMSFLLLQTIARKPVHTNERVERVVVPNAVTQSVIISFMYPCRTLVCGGAILEHRSITRKLYLTVLLNDEHHSITRKLYLTVLLNATAAAAMHKE